MIARNPAFSAVAVLALALGIGPNSAIFSIVNAVLLRPLPLKNADRVVSVWESLKSKGLGQIPASAANYLDWNARNHVFEQMGTAFALPEFGFNVMAGRQPERVPGAKASASFFDTIGASMFLGRPFLPEEDRPGGTPVAIVSYGFWQRHLGASPDAIGRSMRVDGVPRTVVGVLPANFNAFGHQDVWIPMAMDVAANERGNRTYGVFARMKPGVTVARAQAEMEGIAGQIAREHPETNQGWGVVVIPLRQLVGGFAAPALMVLLGAVGLLLLLACANMANLLLARAAGRQREIAIRTALGAGRLQIVRQLLAESVVLSLAGGAVGLLLAAVCVSLVRGVVPDMLARMQQMDIDYRVVAFTFLLSLVTGLVFGAVPALKVSNPDLNDTLKASSRSVSAGGVQRIRSVLVVAEVASAVVLSVAAGLLVRSFVRLMSVDPGLRTKNVLTMQLTLPAALYPEEDQRARFFRNLTDRVEALPGVESAGAIHFLPFRSSFLNSRISVWPFLLEGKPPVPAGQEPDADCRFVTPHYFETMAIALRQGRYFTAHDGREGPPVVIINEALARKHMPGENPIGKRLKLPPWDQPAREIVGVVADAKLYALDWTSEPAIYVPHAQRPNDVMSLVVHSSRDTASLAAAIRQEVHSIDPAQPVADIRPMESVVSDSLMLRRISMAMLGVFAALALALATIGVYGLTAYSVAQRTHEIGLRMALGASPLRVLGWVVGRGLVLALIGIAIGLAAAFGVGRILSSFLFGITGTDPMVVCGVPLVLLSVAALANYLPARRAARVDPIVALRCE